MQNGNFRKRIWFSGRVQGVGFRYKTRQVAQGYDVCGTVQNLDDGRVELCVQGDELQIDAFVSDLKTVMADFIRKVEERSDYVDFSYRGFEIIP